DAKLKEVRRSGHAQGHPQIGDRGNYADDVATALFPRETRARLGPPRPAFAALRRGRRGQAATGFGPSELSHCTIYRARKGSSCSENSIHLSPIPSAYPTTPFVPRTWPKCRTRYSTSCPAERYRC